MGTNLSSIIHDTRYRAIAAQLAAAILWSFGGMLIKLVDLHPIAITGIRSCIAIIVIFMFLDKSKLKLTWNKFFGGLAYASMVISFVSATKATTSANAILLQYSAPIYIALFGGWLLKEKARKKDWITILFVIGGMVLFFMDDISGGSALGNGIAIFSGVAMAFNTMLMRKQRDADPLENIFWGSLITILVCSPYIFTASPSPKSWLGLVLLGVFQLGLSYVLYAKAIKKISAMEATFLALVEPLLNPVWVFLMVGELPGPLSLVGGLIVLASVTISCLQPKKETEVKVGDEKTVDIV